jgi:hypothetical protein
MKLSEKQLRSVIREEVAALSQAPKRREKRDDPDPYLPPLARLEKWEDLPKSKRKLSIERDEEAALEAGHKLLQALDRLGDYEHYDQVGRLLSSMRETYGKF